MKRLDDEGTSTLVAIRLPPKTNERLDALIANLPPHPVGGPLPRSTVLRAIIDAGIDALAIREGIAPLKVGTANPINEKPQKVRTSKATGGKTVHRASRARAERRAEARRRAGCSCKSRHVPTCKLYQSSAA